MKKLIPTLVLVLVCAGLYLYASSNHFFKEEEKQPVKLLDVTEQNVQSIVIMSTPQAKDGAGGETGTDGTKKDTPLASEPVTTQIDWAGDGWKMMKPDAYPLNGITVDQWFGNLNGITQDMVIEENAGDLAKYGLSQPKTVITLTQKDGTTHKLRIGDALPVSGYVYAAAEDSNTVYRVSESAVSSLSQQPIDFIDKNPLRFDTDAITSLRVMWKGAEWSLAKTEKDKSASESKWKLGDKELAGSDASQITSAARFLATDILPKSAAAAGIGTDSSDLTIEVVTSQNGADVAKTYRGKLEGDNVWVAASDGTWAYAITLQAVQELFDKGKQ